MVVIVINLKLQQRWRGILSCLCIVHATCHAEDETLIFDFPRLKAATDAVRSSGRGTFRFGEFTLEADNMVFDKASQNVRLVGNVVILHPNYRLETLFVDYNLKSRSGSTGSLKGQTLGELEPRVSKGAEDLTPGGFDNRNTKLKLETTMDRHLYFRANHAKISENDLGEPHLVLHGTKITDCDKDHPHHEIYIDRLHYSQGRFAEMHHAIPRLAGIPYFYFPYAGRDLSRDWPWTRWTFGSTRDWGRYLQFEIKPWQNNNDLKFTYAGRDKRGHAAELDWDSDEPGLRRHLRLGGWMERYEQSDDLIFEDERWRIDYTERRQLSEHWKLSMDFHALDRRDEAYWITTLGAAQSKNFWASPFPTAEESFQERENLIEDYDEEQWLRGHLLENEVLLEFDQGNRHFEIGSLYPYDGEQLTGRIKTVHMRYRHLVEPLGGGWLGTAEIGLGQQGQRLGWHLSDEDLATLGSIRRKEHQTWRFDAHVKAERQFMAGPLSIRPWVGAQALGFGELYKDKDNDLNFFDHQDTDVEKNVWAPRSLAGMEFSSLASAHYKKGKVLHQVRPSLEFRYSGASRYHRNRVISEVDRFDRLTHPRFELRYSLRNEVVRASDPERLYYVQSLDYRQLFREQDEIEFFGKDKKDDFNARFAQAFYPASNFKVFNEARVNIYRRDKPWLFAGLEVNKWGQQWSYSFNYFEDVDEKIHRHDVKWSYMTNHNDFNFSLSFDGEAPDSELKDDDFYNRGFRKLSFAWGHLFHCLRGEVEVEYDFENSGATVMFGFGPDVFRGSLPHLRNGL